MRTSVHLGPSSLASSLPEISHDFSRPSFSSLVPAEMSDRRRKRIWRMKRDRFSERVPLYVALIGSALVIAATILLARLRHGEETPVGHPKGIAPSAETPSDG